MDSPMQLKDLARQELQKYVDTPPGRGLAVIYVHLFPNGKMYTGLHRHGAKGQSFARSRKCKEGANGKRTPLVHRGFLKYGAENVKHFIVWHGEEELAPAQEGFFMNGLNTLFPGGYNIRKADHEKGPSSELLSRIAKRVQKRINMDTDKVESKRAKLSAAFKGKARPEWSIEKQRDSYSKFKAQESKFSAFCKKRSENAYAMYSDPVRKQEIVDKRMETLHRTNKYDEWKTRVVEAIRKRVRDPVLRATLRQKTNAAKARTQLVKDAKKYIHLMAKCSNDGECRLILEQYKKVLKQREALAQRRAKKRDRQQPLAVTNP